jgi:hypothetical protein
MADIHINGLDALIRKFNSFEKVLDVVEPVIADRTRRNRIRAQIYPPPLPRQRYVRTYKLRGGWSDRVQRSSSGIQGIASNRGVPYAPAVQGYGTQEAIHRGRWETDQQILDAETPGIVEDMTRIVQAELDK